MVGLIVLSIISYLYVSHKHQAQRDKELLSLIMSTDSLLKGNGEIAILDSLTSWKESHNLEDYDTEYVNYFYSKFDSIKVQAQAKLKRKVDNLLNEGLEVIVRDESRNHLLDLLNKLDTYKLSSKKDICSLYQIYYNRLEKEYCHESLQYNETFGLIWNICSIKEELNFLRKILNVKWVLDKEREEVLRPYINQLQELENEYKQNYKS